jgi:hypothetical protein
VQNTPDQVALPRRALPEVLIELFHRRHDASH